MTVENPVSSGGARFEETQRFRQWWLVLLLVVSLVSTVGVLGVGLYRQLVEHEPFGSHPMSDQGLITLAAVVIPSMLVLVLGVWSMRLTVRVEPAGLSIRFWPFVRRRIAWSEIHAFGAVTYHPIREYGGWGIRGFSASRAYNVSGDRGVRMRLEGDRRLLVGSQRAEALEAAIAAESGRAPGGVD